MKRPVTNWEKIFEKSYLVKEYYPKYKAEEFMSLYTIKYTKTYVFVYKIYKDNFMSIQKLACGCL